MRFTYQTGDQPLSGFTIQRGIHRGGFGEVYFAHSDGGKEVALKLLHRQDQDVEIRGVTQCLNLKHPNLVNLFDIKTDVHGDQWVVMEYVSGSSLDDVLASFPDGLPLAEIRDWLNGLVAGVAHLHDRGIVHRDLKPANVYRENGVVKIGDVGLSKRVDSDHRRQHTQSVGTVYYMAPEVAHGQYGPEVDVYSLGVMLYELITGKLPFTGETTAEILMKHLTAQPDLTPIPKTLRPTVARALEKDPRKRTPTVRDLERDFLRGIGAQSEPLEIPETSFLPRVPSTNSQTRTSPVPQSGNHWHSAPQSQQPPPPVAAHTKYDWQTLLLNEENLPTKIMIVMISLVLLFGRTNESLGRVSFFVATGFAIYYFQKIRSRQSSQVLPLNEQPRSKPIPTYHPARHDRPIPKYSRQASVAPSSHRIDRPWREQWPELANSLGLAALVASLLSAAIFFYPQLFPHHRPPLFTSDEHGILFAATSIVGSWIFLLGNALTNGSTWSKRQRWVVRLAAGLLLGSFAYGLDQFLMVTTPPYSTISKSFLSKLWGNPLVGPGVDPTWLGYCCFFAVWMGLRRWTREMDTHRKKRFRIGTLLTAVVMAFVVSTVFKFPQWYALLWAGTISTTVQLASAWTDSRATPLAHETQNPDVFTDRNAPFERR